MTLASPVSVATLPDFTAILDAMSLTPGLKSPKDPLYKHPDERGAAARIAAARDRARKSSISEIEGDELEDEELFRRKASNSAARALADRRATLVEGAPGASITPPNTRMPTPRPPLTEMQQDFVRSMASISRAADEAAALDADIGSPPAHASPRDGVRSSRPSSGKLAAFLSALSPRGGGRSSR